MHRGCGTASQPATRDEPNVDAVILMRDQDAGTQLHLHNPAHHAIGRGDIEINRRYVVAVFKDGHLPLGGVHVGWRLAHTVAPKCPDGSSQAARAAASRALPATV